MMENWIALFFGFAPIEAFTDFLSWVLTPRGFIKFLCHVLFVGGTMIISGWLFKRTPYWKREAKSGRRDEDYPGSVCTPKQNLGLVQLFAMVAGMFCFLFFDRWFGLSPKSSQERVEDEAPIEVITPPRPSPIEEEPGEEVRKVGAVEAVSCCGDLTEEERARMLEALEAVWQNPVSASPEMLERLPPENVVEEAVTAFSDSKSDVEEELPFDWGEVRLLMLEQMPEGSMKAAAALTMLEADEFMEAMNPTEEAMLEEWFQSWWNRMVERNPDMPTEGIEGVLMRKVVEMTAAFSVSRNLEELRQIEAENPMPMPNLGAGGKPGWE
ncbi:MAG: hypothetical protein M2R45_03865 [Verrucomicrobia subdivision 3 bacterium]|nr:hypothetical protein [Limisphaerales bacterium]MCS1412569.1 hypothetical protein [Limisphaerales bacterium]